LRFDEHSINIIIQLMKDPVMLPSSKNIVDRSAIHRALLSTEQDPFNRQPLKESDVVPLK
jgi:ubiquitin conjugation factor E4 B